MQPHEIQAIIAAILTLATMPLKDKVAGTEPEEQVLRTFAFFESLASQNLTGQASQMSPAP
jgi:hypothetical protein